MAKIQPVEFPLNTGTAIEIEYHINANSTDEGAMISYFLISTEGKRITINQLPLTDTDYRLHGTDRTWLFNHIASHIGAVLI